MLIWIFIVVCVIAAFIYRCFEKTHNEPVEPDRHFFDGETGLRIRERPYIFDEDEDEFDDL
ncbi:MAG: hypothetical protein NC308_11840 [Clostridium sp.]|nr:hypothetical protein [Bacteroides sp.]MCM1199570.1 hypothetical protein [Clostridium sp.]